MSKINSIHDAWIKLKIVQETVEACRDMRDDAENEKSEQYWDKCAEFLDSLKSRDYKFLSVKQRNWAKTIIMDLQDEGYGI
jgi:hypothetical protein